MRKVFTAIAAAIGLVSSLIGIPAGLIELDLISQDHVRDAIWPVGVVAALVLMLLLAVGYVISLKLRERARGPASEDQELLDELLHVLHRSAIRRIEDQDFYDSWPSVTSSAAIVFVEGYGDHEHSFRDPALEAARADLYEKAKMFMHVEALRGFVSRHNRGWRDAGYTPGEAEGIPEREKLIEGRSEEISAAAQAFTQAHDQLVRAARDRGYRVDALSRDKHPRVQQLDDIRDPPPDPPPSAASW